jgi:hypothetical protein
VEGETTSPAGSVPGWAIAAEVPGLLPRHRDLARRPQTSETTNSARRADTIADAENHVSHDQHLDSSDERKLLARGLCHAVLGGDLTIAVAKLAAVQMRRPYSPARSPRSAICPGPGAAFRFSLDAMWPEVSHLNLIKLVPAVQIPVFFLGRNDHWVPRRSASRTWTYLPHRQRGSSGLSSPATSRSSTSPPSSTP